MKIIEHTAGRVAGAGFFHMPAEVYHADPAPEPSLSSSIAKLIVNQSPEHAWHAHPRLGRPADAEESDPTRPKEIGTAAHKLLLGRGGELVVVDGEDYKKAAAREARAAAYADGACPILAPDLALAETLADQALARLARIPGCEGFDTAAAEVVAIVRHPSGAWLRTMMDKVEIHAAHAVIWDVKTGDQAAAPQGLGRRIENLGMEVQAALYVQVLETLLPHLAGRIVFRWVFVENDKPHAVTVAEIDAAGLHVGGRKLDAALHRWNAAHAAGHWPGYPEQIVRVDFPEWATKRWAEREEIDPQLAGVAWDIARSPFRPLDMESAA